MALRPRTYARWSSRASSCRRIRRLRLNGWRSVQLSTIRSPGFDGKLSQYLRRQEYWTPRTCAQWL